MIIPNIWENKKCSKPPTSHGFSRFSCFGDLVWSWMIRENLSHENPDPWDPIEDGKCLKPTTKCQYVLLKTLKTRVGQTLILLFQMSHLQSKANVILWFGYPFLTCHNQLVNRDCSHSLYSTLFFILGIPKQSGRRGRNQSPKINQSRSFG